MHLPTPAGRLDAARLSLQAVNTPRCAHDVRHIPRVPCPRQDIVTPSQASVNDAQGPDRHAGVPCRHRLARGGLPLREIHRHLAARDGNRSPDTRRTAAIGIDIGHARALTGRALRRLTPVRPTVSRRTHMKRSTPRLPLAFVCATLACAFPVMAQDAIAPISHPAVTADAPAVRVDPAEWAMFRACLQRVPPYPTASIRAGEQGRTLVGYVVEPDGRFGAAFVHTSSGFERLDVVAVRHVEHCMAERDGRVAASQPPGRYVFPMRWQLE